ncbi:LAO/AO transport system kinase [Dyadobacter jejuensis]|uniref:LAO/AO transport system kinase n=1 Tax=Dyadobacter jejuensis TaxID=1082580 RepID=A0A316AQ47_9BACT|nr:methylmalonyl Co-A mutase-associated GTPase MeaB [Dyadobacter jejuensis]PWJ59853.1 LAO/AO transport system kinase [Dyadobacter jejuensis]
MRPRLTLKQYTTGILAADRHILSRAITLVESQLPTDKQLAQELIKALMPHTGRAFRIAISGAPGVGKSTFLETLGSTIVQQEHKLAILAVDPSSSRSGGSILGDKSRMPLLAQHPQVYIRPSPTTGILGGVAEHTREAMLLCEAAGYAYICIETVGVGQSETMVQQMTDLFLLLMMPGAGDELQGIKRGILEMTDLLVINKADGPGSQAASAAQQFRMALKYLPTPASGIAPPVFTCSALERTGITEIWQYILHFQKQIIENGFLERQRKNQNLDWMHHQIQNELLGLFYKNKDIQDLLHNLEPQIAQGQLWPGEAVQRLIDRFKNQE